MEEVFLILFGLVIGSFLNVVIHRLPRGQSVVWPGSRCPSCETPIRFYQNIPVFSYLALRGRCAYCRTRISIQYPLVELLTAFTFWLAVVFVTVILCEPFSCRPVVLDVSVQLSTTALVSLLLN